MAEAFAVKQPKQTDQGPLEYERAVENSIRRPLLGYLVNSHHIKQQYRFKEEIKSYVPLIENLEHALSKPLFCCGGSLKPLDMDKIVLKVKPVNSEADKEDWREFKLHNLPVTELLEYCIPAPFGDLKEMKTVLDPDVRVAYEIESTRFKTEIERVWRDKPFLIRGIPGEQAIQAHIEDTLTPGSNVRVDQYKLNVYGEGGFFKPHVDHPSAHEMTGTLVICLPSPHKGGELYVNHDGLQHIFDFSQHSGDASKIQWAAFYSDCIHEVKPVLEGHRVTVTYNITLHYLKSHYYDSELKVSLEEHFEASTESPSLTSRALDNIHSELEEIRRKGKSGSPTRVGFLLKHKYTSKGFKPHLLKGEDKALVDFLIEKQWKCKLTSVLSRYQTVEIHPDGMWEDGELEETHEIYEFSPMMCTPPAAWRVHHDHRDKRQYRDFRHWRAGIPFIEIYRKSENAEVLVRNNEGSGSWIGNEVEDVGVDKIYLDSAVIVELCDKP